MKPKSILATSWMLVLFLCAGQKFVSVVRTEDSDVKRYAGGTGLFKQDAANNETDANAITNPDANSTTNLDTNSAANPDTNSATNPDANPNPSATSTASDVEGNILTAISVTSAVLTLLEAFDRRVLPQPTTDKDILDGVRRLEDLIRPSDEGQYKKAEDTISRALYDMGVMNSGVGRQGSMESSEFQEFLWLERARLIDGNIILLMEGLLGQPVAGADLMGDIQSDLKCDAMDVSEKVNRYHDLIESGSLAFNHFARLGQMSELETSRRRAAFRQRNLRVQARNVKVVEECFQRQLSEVRSDSATSDEVAEQVGQVISSLYPLPTRWIVAAYADDQGMSRGAVKPMKSKLSADFNVMINGFHVALFPFLDGKMTKMIDGRRVDQFCNLPVQGAGQMPICDVGSTDGEYVYDELRRLGIVPDSFDLIVVPSGGQLSVTTVPFGSLPPFYAKKYPDFNIIVF